MWVLATQTIHHEIKREREDSQPLLFFFLGDTAELSNFSDGGIEFVPDTRVCGGSGDEPWVHI